MLAKRASLEMVDLFFLDAPCRNSAIHQNDWFLTNEGKASNRSFGSFAASPVKLEALCVARLLHETKEAFGAFRIEPECRQPGKDCFSTAIVVR